MKIDTRKMKYSKHFLLSFLIGMFVNGVIIGGFSIESVPLIERLSIDMSRFDIYLTQVSVSFIIISLVSVLSTTTRVVYWEDVSQYKLIKPPFTGFIDYTAYILACLTFSTICVVLSSNLIIISFLLSVGCLAALTIKMIGSYFGRDSVKRELKDKYLRVKSDNPDEYEKLNRTLIENTYKAIDSKDYQIVEENVALLMEGKEYKQSLFIMEHIENEQPESFCSWMIENQQLFNTANINLHDYYYHILHSCLINYIKKNSYSMYADRLFALYLDGRVKQIEKGISSYEDNGLESSKGNVDASRKRSQIYRQHLGLDRYSLGMVYTACIENDNYELLNDFLSHYCRKMKTVEEIIKDYYSDPGFAERLKQIYVMDLELKKLNLDLIEKVQSKDVDIRQINIVLRSLIDIYCVIEKLESEEVKGYIIGQFDTLSKEVLKDSYNGLIREIACNEMLTAWTCHSKIRCGSEFIHDSLNNVRTMVIDTV